MSMSLSRIKYLRECLDYGNIDLMEISEIEEAFEELGTKKFEYRDNPDEALAGDMLDELETVISPLERRIYDYVAEHYGENEANDPSWDIQSLANHLEGK